MVAAGGVARRRRRYSLSNGCSAAPLWSGATTAVVGGSGVVVGAAEDGGGAAVMWGDGGSDLVGGRPSAVGWLGGRRSDGWGRRRLAVRWRVDGVSTCGRRRSCGGRGLRRQWSEAAAGASGGKVWGGGGGLVEGTGGLGVIWRRHCGLEEREGRRVYFFSGQNFAKSRAFFSLAGARFGPILFGSGAKDGLRQTMGRDLILLAEYGP